MLKSMTGYGKSSFQSDDWYILVEMKSVNHRFSEFSVRLPKAFLMFEDKVRRIVSRYVKRGKVDIFVTIEGENLLPRDLYVDWPLMDTFIKALHTAREKHQLSGELTVDHLLHLPDIFTVVEKEADPSKLADNLLQTVDDAAKEMVSMRMREGEVIRGHLGEKLENINALLETIKERAPMVTKDFQKRLHKKLTDYLDGPDYDEARLLTEVAVFSEKANIEEELTRLKSHYHQFCSIIKEGGVVGRKLDFLAQEMNREINTIGSKANDLIISQQVVELKSELEMIKEQIQNIE